MAFSSPSPLPWIVTLCAAIGSTGWPAARAEPVSAAVMANPPSQATQTTQPADPPIGPETIPAGPEKPTPPPAIPQPKVIDAFRCERKFTYKGKVFDCDSNVERDAERLRPLMTDVPAAIAELDTYQRNRQTVRKSAYVGSVGLFAIVVGVIASRFLTDSNGNLTGTGKEVQNYSAFGGGALALISFGVSWVTLYKNETYVDNAVKLHNEAHPGSPIQLTTGFSF